MCTLTKAFFSDCGEGAESAKSNAGRLFQEAFTPEAWLDLFSRLFDEHSKFSDGVIALAIKSAFRAIKHPELFDSIVRKILAQPKVNSYTGPATDCRNLCRSIWNHEYYIPEDDYVSKCLDSEGIFIVFIRFIHHNYAALRLSPELMGDVMAVCYTLEAIPQFNVLELIVEYVRKVSPEAEETIS